MMVISDPAPQIQKLKAKTGCQMKILGNLFIFRANLNINLISKQKSRGNSVLAIYGRFEKHRVFEVVNPESSRKRLLFPVFERKLPQHKEHR